MSTETRHANEAAVRRRLPARWPMALLLVPLCVLPFYLDAYAVGEVTMVLVFAFPIMGLNLLTGYLGQMSLGHGALLALGAYVMAILQRDTELSVPSSILISMGVTFALGLVVGVLVLRVRGVYLALITMTLALAVAPIIKRFPDITGGSQGIIVVTDVPEPFGLAADQTTYFGVLACLALALVAFGFIVRGRSGRALAAIKDNEIVARSLGVNLTAVKTLVFAASSALCGLGGALYAIVIGFVSPETFGLLLSVNLLAAMVIGGGGTLLGPLIGAAFYQYLPIASGEINPALGGLVYGIALVVVMIAAPQGVTGALSRWVPARRSIRPRRVTVMAEEPPNDASRSLSKVE